MKITSQHTTKTSVNALYVTESGANFRRITDVFTKPGEDIIKNVERVLFEYAEGEPYNLWGFVFLDAPYELIQEHGETVGVPIMNYKLFQELIAQS